MCANQVPNTHNNHPISKPHPHRITCYIEALERGMGWRSWRMYWLADGVAIVELTGGL